MALHLYTLFPSRPKTFAAGMTPAEASVMHEHGNYWEAYGAAGTVLILGPVADPERVF